MAQISVTVISIKTDGTRSYVPPSPVSMSIGVGDDYDLSPAGTGSVLYNSNTDTEYSLVESVAVIAALIAAPADVTINNTGNDGYSLDVTLQDQHTPLVVVPFTNKFGGSVTTAPIAIDEVVIPVASLDGAIVGSNMTLFDPVSVRYSQFKIVAINTLDVTVDRLIDFAFPAGSYIDYGSDNLAVNGSVTPVVFGIRNPSGAPADIVLTLDVTRIVFSVKTASAVDLSKFGDLSALTNGLLLRQKNGDIYNIFNVKTNSELAGVSYDWKPYAATNPSQGQDGYVCRLTWASQGKMGAVVRLPIGEDLELIVQDNLLGITDFVVTAEGSLALD